MRPRDHPSLSSPVPIFVRGPDVAPDLRLLPALGRSPYRHAPVTAFEWAMLAAGMAWAQVFLDPWPASWLRRCESIGILIGIVAQPLFATFFMLASKD